MKSLVTFFLVIVCGSAFCQNIAINIDGSSPDPSAILELKSDNRGFLPPRLTTAQRNSIVIPAIGLLVYNIDTGCLNVYDGVSWRDYCPDFPTVSCPSGMVDMGYYRIDINARPASNFFPAVVTCRNLGPRVRLCTAAEWYYACQTGLIPSMPGNYEWVDDFAHQDNIILIGGSWCDDTTVGQQSTSHIFRCCCDY